MLEQVRNDNIEIYKECMEQLNDEINIIKSIFSTEHDHIMVHTETFPIIIELCLSSTNSIAKLYMTFLCPIDYPLQSSIKSSIYFSGPTSFATNNQICVELQLKLQEMATNSIGEQHLFDIVQFGKEWIEQFEQRYNDHQQSTLDHNKYSEYIELRTALGLIENDKYVPFKTTWATETQTNCKINSKTKQRVKEEQATTQCYSSWEIDETIQKLIKTMSIKWKCNKAMAKKKLTENLWQSDQGSIDKQLEKTRKHRIHNTEGDEAKNNDESMYDIKLNLLAPQTSEIGGDLQLKFPEIDTFECPVCLEENSFFNGIRIHCQHLICLTCLSGYIYNQIDNGIICIKCPSFKCKSYIDDCIIHILSDNLTYIRYRSFLQNSFLETCRGWKFCPNPRCNSAVKPKRGIPLLPCNCNTPLCTSCMDKFHWPLKCKANKLWAEKTKSKIDLQDPNLPDLPKFEGQKYEMTVLTKQCPKCGTHWEKNGGCNHIHCRKCKYHFCWVCLKEFNHTTHDDFYVCKQGINKSTKQSLLTMERPTERYAEEYKRVLNQRQQLREEHEQKVLADSQRKMQTKRAIQHERASIFLEQKYLRKPQRLKRLLKNIINATQETKEKVPKKLDIEFIYELMSRLIQAHLLLSRGYKYISYHSMSDNDTVVCILKSLEHVAFKLDAMFQAPKVYLPWKETRCEWNDLGYFIDCFISEMMKVVKPQKYTKYIGLKYQYG